MLKRFDGSLVWSALLVVTLLSVAGAIGSASAADDGQNVDRELQLRGPLPSCAITMTVVNMISTRNQVLKFFASAQMCSRQAFNNVYLCLPVNGNVIGLTVSATMSAVSPFCSWTCNSTCSVVTDSSDGLPVELMDFSVGE